MKTALLWLVIGLQSVWVIGTVVFQETQLAQGTPILLETRPVDPRDLLRGDYVILRYDISSVPVNAFTPPELRPEGEFSRLHRASWTPLTAEPGNVVLRGRALPQGFGGDTLPVALEVQYDIERYYVREGTGNPRGKLTVLVSVPKSGRGIVRQVFVDGVPYVEAMKGTR
jgi:uncharacterized membrane-anchored protein